jgi:hypothetical protein
VRVSILNAVGKKSLHVEQLNVVATTSRQYAAQVVGKET